MPNQANVQLWGWDTVTSAWVRVLVNSAGKLIIDPTEIFENPPTDNEHGKAADSDWSYDHNADPNAHHAAFTAVDHTAIGDAAPHHSQAHTLASHTTKAHAELTGIGADDHHTRYTDAEALAAAVQAGAITDGVTKAPTHDAVYDVKITADGAIAKSLLTTEGDIIYRNATVPARLPKGNSGDVLTMGASDPAWAAPTAGGLSSKVKTATRVLDAVDGDVGYTGIGFKPTSIIAIGIETTNKFRSEGYADSAKGMSCFYWDNTPVYYTTTSYLLYFRYTAGTNYERALLKSYDNDGFTLTWSKAGAVSATANLMFLCLK